MRHSLVILILLIVSSGCAQSRENKQPAQRPNTLHIVCVESDSCMFAGRDSSGQETSITIRRDASVSRFFNRWSATCTNVAFGPNHLQDISAKALSPVLPENGKMDAIAKYVEDTIFWSAPGTRTYIL